MAVILYWFREEKGRIKIVRSDLKLTFTTNACKISRRNQSGETLESSITVRNVLVTLHIQ